MTDTTVAGEELRAHVERRERLLAQKQDILDDIKEHGAEIKSAGYDMPAFNAVIARRKKERDDVNHADAMIETYETALGSN